MATTLEAWLNIPHFDDCEGWFNVAGELAFQRFNPGEFYRETLVSTIIAQFPHIRSVTEYGCGVGRNLLYLKRRFPDIRCFGYELVPEGVEIAQAAASKFCVDVEYAQLDYVRDPVAKYIFESTDVAFTMFSLEQLPSGCDIALRNILQV